jgi:hypothetical protein
VNFPVGFQYLRRLVLAAACGSYGASLFSHIHIALRVRPTEVRRARNLFNG